MTTARTQHSLFTGTTATHSLPFSNREGTFNGMAASHTFNVLIVKAGHGVRSRRKLTSPSRIPVK
ncbi:MAG TPA: hypothetical protein VGR71_02125 [Nitrospira sp.]|nr:hypothetical protein [Nitrospira sp.]